MNWTTILDGTDFTTAVTGAITAAVAIGVPILALRMGPGLVLSVLSKFGVRK